jgi:hypothetical protein
MRHLVSIGLAAAQSLNATSAQAGPCSNEIARIESALRRPAADIGPTGHQTIGAQLHQQPTPGSVERAEEGADSRLHAALARARTFDVQDDGTECLKAVEEDQTADPHAMKVQPGSLRERRRRADIG